MNIGLVCPKYNRVYAPHIIECKNCNNNLCEKTLYENAHDFSIGGYLYLYDMLNDEDEDIPESDGSASKYLNRFF